MQINFRKMTPEDASAVEIVEKSCFDMPWSRQSFWQEASNDKAYYLLALDGEIIKISQERKANAMTLEVRPSNKGAIHLYESLGFKSVGRRRGYYEDGEDAEIMWITDLTNIK